VLSLQQAGAVEWQSALKFLYRSHTLGGPHLLLVCDLLSTFLDNGLGALHELFCRAAGPLQQLLMKCSLQREDYVHAPFTLQRY